MSSATSTAPPPKRRAVFILFEGTDNDFRDDAGTNVQRMLRLLRKDDEDRQVIYYGEGLGSHDFGSDTLSGGSKVSTLKHALSLGIGMSFPEHVLDAYRWLMNVHRKDDEIYVMGFSRGAYAAGCFCGLIEAIGLLPRENTQLISTGWELYSKFSAEASDRKKDLGTPAFKYCWDHTRSFRTNFSKLVRIHFLGLWDTVASIGIDNSAPYLFPQHRGSVKHVLHAMALDEIRNRFPVQRFSSVHSNLAPLWRAVHSSDRIPALSAEKQFELEIKEAAALTTEILEVWFPGNHTDCGGGGHNDVLLKTTAQLVPKGIAEPHSVTIDVEDRLPKPALGYLSLRWMLRSLLQRQGPGVEILIDPLAAARADLELSYGLFPDTTAQSQDVWPAEHVKHLLKSSKEDRAGAKVRHSHILDAPPAEVELAILKSWPANEMIPNEDPGKWHSFKEYLMPYYWDFREWKDGSLGERRHVWPNDKLHISVRTRWLASRLTEEQLKLILGVNKDADCGDQTCSNREEDQQSEAQALSHHGEKVSPKTFLAQAPEDVVWSSNANRFRLIHEPYYPLSHGGGAERHTHEEDKAEANARSQAEWKARMDRLEEQYEHSLKPDGAGKYPGFEI
ncbi:unnamed protein product [Sympodiomycopsis kandeliae]